MRNCFICGSSGKKLLLVDKFSHIVRCKNCGFVYDDQLGIVEEKVEPYYLKGEVGHYSIEDLKNREKVRRPMKLGLIEDIKKVVKNPRLKKLLDIGCSTGDFLQIAREEGFNVFGLDVSERVCAIAKKRLGKNVIFKGNVFEVKFPSNSFDVINLSNVLLHVDDPLKFMQEVYRIVKPKGYVFIEEANYKHFLYKNLIYQILFHTRRGFKYSLNFFTLESIMKFLKKTKFEVYRNNYVFYSDHFARNYIGKDLQKKPFFTVLIKLNTFLKIDKILSLPLLLHVVLTKNN